MNYYITLPSSGADLQSEYGKKNNTQTDFFTNLGKSIDISNQEYEVALVEISFRVSWLVNLGTFEITSLNPMRNFKQEYKENISVIDYENLTKLTNELGNELESKFLENKETIAFEINHQLKKNSNKLLNVHKSLKFFALSNAIIIHIPTDFQFMITGYFTQILRNLKAESNSEFLPSSFEMKEFMDHNVTKQENHLKITGNDNFTIKADFVKENITDNEQLFVYSDIIEYQFIGSDMAQLLRVVTVNNKLNDSVNIIYNKPHYVSLLRKKINSIRMFMRDNQGNPIKFKDGDSKVIYKLHLRPKKL